MTEKTNIINAFDVGTELFYKNLKKRDEDALFYCLMFCNTWAHYAQERCDPETRDYILARLNVLIQDAQLPVS